MHLTSRRFEADAAVRGGGPAGFAGAPAAVRVEKQRSAGEPDGRGLRARPAAGGAQLKELPGDFRETIRCAGGEFCANGADTAGICGGRAPAGM